MLWILLTLMTVVAAIGLIMPLVRRSEARRAPGGAVEVLKGQLADLNAEAAARAPGGPQAADLRAEVERRILAEAPAAEPPPRPLNRRSLFPLGLGMAAILAVGAAGLYLSLGRPDLAGVSAAAAPPPAAADRRPEANLAGMVIQLEARMKQSPGDPRGWRLLGWAYMQLGRYADAAGAYGRAGRLDPNTAEYPSAQGEALTQAAGGQVTAAAQDAFRAALAKDSGDPRARYFLAVARDQGGDHAGAMADWIALLRSAPPNAPWVADVRAFVIRIAQRRGETIPGELTSAPPGPNADQIAAARGLPPADRQAMITGMVARLAARLKAHPHDAEGWIRLMRARAVLGDRAAALGAYRAALAAFADSPSEQGALRIAAREMEIPGA